MLKHLFKFCGSLPTEEPAHEYKYCGLFGTKYYFYSPVPRPVVMYMYHDCSLARNPKQFLPVFAEELDAAFEKLAPYLVSKMLWDKSFYSPEDNMGASAGFLSEDKQAVSDAYDARCSYPGTLKCREELVLLDTADALRAAIEFEDLITDVYRELDRMAKSTRRQG